MKRIFTITLLSLLLLAAVAPTRANAAPGLVISNPDVRPRLDPARVSLRLSPPRKPQPAPAKDIYCQTRPLHPELCQDDPPPDGGPGDPPPPPPTYPPSISGSVSCSSPGANGWCVAGAAVNLSASDPQGYGTVISGDLAGTPFSCTGPSCTQALSEGSGTINFQASAPASGLSSGVGSTTFAFDQTPPAASLVISGLMGANGWQTSAVASATGSDATSGIASRQVSVDGGAWQSSATLADGIHSVVGRAIDNAGHQTVTPAQVVKVDTTAPTVSAAVTSGTLVAGWYVTDLAFTASASDATSGLALIESRLDGGAWSPGNSLVVSSEGTHQVDFRATDQAGLRSTASQSVQVDQTPPTMTFTPTGTLSAGGWYTSPVSLQVSATDALSGVDSIEYRLNGGSWTPGNSLTLNDGRQTVEARSTDRAGNWSIVSTAETLDLQVDTTAPTLSISLSGSQGLADWYVSAVTASANVSDATSGIALTESRLDGGAWKNGERLIVSTDGPHTVDFRTKDYAGNVTTASSSFKLDTTQPISVFTSPLEGTEIKAADTVLFTGTSADALSGLASTEISLDGGETWQALPQTGGAWSYAWDTLHVQDGHYTILVHADDQAGNRENTAKVRVVVGNRPPKVEIQASWWLWETGTLQVQQRQIELREVTVRISCAPYHPDLVLTYPGERLPSELKWDRLCGNGAYAAESGNYPVTVTACDTFGHCAEASGVIKVPFLAPPVPTWTPTSEPIPTAKPIRTQKATPAPTAQQVAPTVHPVVTVAPPPEPRARVPTRPIGVFALSAFSLGFCFVALADRRPRALHRLAQTLRKLE